jgi:hypothetical protein
MSSGAIVYDDADSVKIANSLANPSKPHYPFPARVPRTEHSVVVQFEI